MTAVVGGAALAPVYAAPDLRSEQVTQLVQGETAVVLEGQGDWRRLRLHEDGYEGWVHAGYLIERTEGEIESWRSRAAWSNGALVQVATERRWVPLRARVALTDGEVEFPDGALGRVISGAVQPTARVQVEARLLPPEDWARTRFSSAPYLWGGVTQGGVDCSGLVQTTWLARGVRLPRDASQQASHGTEVAFNAMRAGDLLFFRAATGPEINHVAFAGPDATLVHSSVAAGGVVVESWLPGNPAAPLMERLASVRRLDEAEGAPHG